MIWITPPPAIPGTSTSRREARSGKVKNRMAWRTTEINKNLFSRGSSPYRLCTYLSPFSLPVLLNCQAQPVAAYAAYLVQSIHYVFVAHLLVNLHNHEHIGIDPQPFSQHLLELGIGNPASRNVHVP